MQIRIELHPQAYRPARRQRAFENRRIQAAAGQAAGYGVPEGIARTIGNGYLKLFQTNETRSYRGNALADNYGKTVFDGVLLPYEAIILREGDTL